MEYTITCQGREVNLALMGLHPHQHMLVLDGCFHEKGMFSVSPAVDTKSLEKLFRHKVLKMFIRLGGVMAKGKTTQDMITLLEKWRHAGFNVFFGQRILPLQGKSMKNLAQHRQNANLRLMADKIRLIKQAGIRTKGLLMMGLPGSPVHRSTRISMHWEHLMRTGKKWTTCTFCSFPRGWKRSSRNSTKPILRAPRSFGVMPPC